MIQDLETALTGAFRRDVIDAAARFQPFGRALAELRRSMQAHRWRGGDLTLDLASRVDDLDRRTREEGFHVLHDWDGKAAAVTANTIAIDVLDFLADARGTEETDRTALAILVDYYFLYLLALLSMRAWDEANPAGQLDRITQLLGQLQGEAGSGQKFADDAETLILLATSHYEPDERGYQLLLARVRVLPRANRVAVALGHAHAMGGHLRYGYELTCGGDRAATREDNVADYPWLAFALAELMEEFARLTGEGEAVGSAGARDRIVEGLANAIVPDAAALVGRPTATLAAIEPDRIRFAELFERHRPVLLEAFKRYRPLDRAYSPLSLYYNFSQNLVKGTVADALMLGEAWNLSLNDLFTGLPPDDARNVGKEKLARTLMGYARRHPDVVRGRPTPMVIYDPVAARRAFAEAMRTLAG